MSLPPVATGFLKHFPFTFYSMLKQASKDKIVYGEESYFPLKDSGFYDAKVDTFTKFAQSKNQLNTLLVQTANLLTSTSKEEFVYSPNCQLLSADNLKIVQHFEKLKERLNDKHSKVLITGDLNSGKSTFVNTLLKRQIVPDDQEPCTALFVEVIDQKENQDKEEVHCINDIGLYNPLDSTTFKSIKIDELRDEVENEEPQFNLLKVYCKDNEDDTKLLHNGLVDISLIDSPGLNIDSLKTTALFTKQEEIDVIVFVVNAENHFTLSGKEFLETATKEKQYVFIVVNKFDSIRKKERNQREILEQIRSISKSTYEDRENLVHFVSSKKTFEHYITGTEDQNQDLDYVAGFEKLKTALRSFVLERRMNSKLAPAKLYLHNVLLDLEYVLESNLQLQFRIQEDITMKMEKSEPGYTKLVQIQKKINSIFDLGCSK